MKPDEWNAILAPSQDWKQAYAAVEREVRAYLSLEELGEITTTGLVELIYPAQFARGDGITARYRLFKALAALATHDLADCCTRGEPKLGKHKKTIRPWIWHAPKPKPVAVCPNCGYEL